MSETLLTLGVKTCFRDGAAQAHLKNTIFQLQFAILVLSGHSWQRSLEVPSPLLQTKDALKSQSLWACPLIGAGAVGVTSRKPAFFLRKFPAVPLHKGPLSLCGQWSLAPSGVRSRILGTVSLSSSPSLSLSLSLSLSVSLSVCALLPGCSFATLEVGQIAAVAVTTGC